MCRQSVQRQKHNSSHKRKLGKKHASLRLFVSPMGQPALLRRLRAQHNRQRLFPRKSLHLAVEEVVGGRLKYPILGYRFSVLEFNEDMSSRTVAYTVRQSRPLRFRPGRALPPQEQNVHSGRLAQNARLRRNIHLDRRQAQSHARAQKPVVLHSRCIVSHDWGTYGSNRDSIPLSRWPALSLRHAAPGRRAPLLLSWLADRGPPWRLQSAPKRYLIYREMSKPTHAAIPSSHRIRLRSPT